MSSWLYRARNAGAQIGVDTGPKPSVGVMLTCARQPQGGMIITGIKVDSDRALSSWAGSVDVNRLRGAAAKAAKAVSS